MGSVYNANGKSRTSFACPFSNETMFNESKWVKEGGGYVSVLPLYHGCSSSANRCHRAVDRTLKEMKTRNRCEKTEADDIDTEESRLESMIREQPTNL